MWKTTNYNGEQVWYSEEEYEALKTKYEIAMKKLAKITEEKLNVKTLTTTSKRTI